MPRRNWTRKQDDPEAEERERVRALLLGLARNAARRPEPQPDNVVSLDDWRQRRDRREGNA